MKISSLLKSRKLPLIQAAVILFLIILVIILAFENKSHADNLYLPSLELTGDVENVLSIYPDGKDLDMDTEKFTADGVSCRGWRLESLIAQASPWAEESTVYLQGQDGMMASIDTDQLGDNWITFGSRGWECISSGYPESLGVKDMKRIILVADDPSQVSSSIKVTGEDGIERTVSPGTLWLKDTVETITWQGQSEKGGHQVSVWLTDSQVKIGSEILRADGNKIERIQS